MENKQIPILIFKEAKGRGWERALTIEGDAKNNHSTIYEKRFQPGVDLFEKMFHTSQIKQNIIKMTIFKPYYTPY